MLTASVCGDIQILVLHCRIGLSIFREAAAGAVSLSYFDNITFIDTRWAFG